MVGIAPRTHPAHIRGQRGDVLPLREALSQEDVNEYRDVCAGVDATAGIDANH